MDLVTIIIISSGVLQLPLLIDLIQFLCPENKLFRLTATLFRYILQLSMNICCIVGLYLLFSIFLPFLMGDYFYYDNELELSIHRSSSMYILVYYTISATCIYVWFNMVANYLLACYTPPIPAFPVHDSNAISSSLLCDSTSKQCSHCLCIKYYRTHHCKICRKCSYLMDHHCPLLGVCVHLSNFRYFYLWLSYGLLGMILACITSFYPFYLCVAKRIYFHSNETWKQQYQHVCSLVGNHSLIFFSTSLGLLATFIIFYFESWLLIHNITTIEYLASIIKKVSHYTSYRNNNDQNNTNNDSKRTARPSTIQSSNGEMSVIDEEANIPTKHYNHQPPYNTEKSFKTLVLKDDPLFTLLLPYPIWIALGVIKPPNRSS